MQPRKAEKMGQKILWELRLSQEISLNVMLFLWIHFYRFTTYCIFTLQLKDELK